MKHTIIRAVLGYASVVRMEMMVDAQLNGMRPQRRGREKTEVIGVYGKIGAA